MAVLLLTTRLPLSFLFLRDYDLADRDLVPDSLCGNKTHFLHTICQDYPLYVLCVSEKNVMITKLYKKIPVR